VPGGDGEARKRRGIAPLSPPPARRPLPYLMEPRVIFRLAYVEVLRNDSLCLGGDCPGCGGLRRIFLFNLGNLLSVVGL